MKIISLDLPAVLHKLHEYAQELVIHRPDIKAVLLFGSLVKESYTGTSDADLLIILSSAQERFLDRIPSFLHPGLPVELEVFPYTVEELCVQLREGYGVGAVALREGQLLAGELPKNIQETLSAYPPGQVSSKRAIS